MKENVYVCYEPLCCEGGGADIMAVFKSENKAKDFVQRYNMGGVCFMIYSLLNLCDDFRFLKILYLFKIIIKVISIVVPILLILFLSIELVKAIVESNEAKINALKKSSIKRIIAAVVVFLVPTFVSLFLSIFNSKDYQNCIVDLSSEKIKSLKLQYEEEKELQYHMQQDQIRQNQENYMNYKKGRKKTFY